MLVASEQKPRDQRRGRRGAVSALMAIVALGSLYVAAPRVAGIEHTCHRIRDKSPAWLALLFEAVSFLGYVWPLRRVATPDNRALHDSSTVATLPAMQPKADPSRFDRFAEAASEYVICGVFFAACVVLLVVWAPSYSHSGTSTRGSS